MKRQSKTLLTWLGIVLLVLGFLTYSVIYRLLNTKTYEPVSMETEVVSVPSSPFSLEEAKREEMAFALPYGDQEQFTILWGTDFHLRRGPMARRKKLYRLLEAAFEETDPDLTVITGDLVFSFAGRRMLEEFASFMEEHRRYWAYCFGNHDGEYTYSRAQLAAVLERYPHALFSRGPDWARGESNYLIALTDGGVPVQALMLLDSHDERRYGDSSGADYIYPSQSAWYRWVSEGIGDVPMYAFFHIPLPEYKLLWESGEAEGIRGDRHVGCPPVNSNFFRTLVEDGDTVATFCGHDHLNDFSGVWEGVTLVTGRSASYGSYGSPRFPKGVKTITLHRDRSRFGMETYTVRDWKP